MGTRLNLTLTRAIDLSSRIVKDDDTIADPLMDLIIGLTEGLADPVRIGIRNEVLKNLYCQTEDFRHRFREYAGEGYEDGIIQTNAIAS